MLFYQMQKYEFTFKKFYSLEEYEHSKLLLQSKYFIPLNSVLVFHLSAVFESITYQLMDFFEINTIWVSWDPHVLLIQTSMDTPATVFPSRCRSLLTKPVQNFMKAKFFLDFTCYPPKHTSPLSSLSQDCSVFTIEFTRIFNAFLEFLYFHKTNKQTNQKQKNPSLFDKGCSSWLSQMHHRSIYL